jgi:putative isomerase
MTMSPYLTLLRNRIDITRVPFSDRGSRLMVYKDESPSRLYIRVAARMIGLDSDFEAYLHHPPFVSDLCLVDEQGMPMDFEVEVWRHMTHRNTRLGVFELVFQDSRTLAFGLPPNVTGGLHFRFSPHYQEATRYGGAYRSVRDLAYATNGRVVRNDINAVTGGSTIEFVVEANDDCTITVAIAKDVAARHEVLPFSAARAAAEVRWHEWFSRVPAVAERYLPTYAYAWWIMGNNLISPRGNVAFESMTPSKVDRVGLWLWDSALHALAYRYVDPEMARNQLRAMLVHQLPTGMLPDAIFDEGIVSTLGHPIVGEVTKPPIMAWAALKLHEADPDRGFLQEIYVPLVRLNSWWYGMNDDDGLAQYNHPYSSGLNDSPLWDYGMPVESPDLNTYLCVQMGSLALMAEELGLAAEGARWRRRSDAVVRRMMEDFWDEEAGLFRALHNEEPIPVVTPFNLYPLWTRRLPQAVHDRLIAHLTRAEEFGGDYVIPTVARNDPHFDPGRTWRGPVWANINYFMIEALQQSGELGLARTIMDRTLDLIMSQPGIFEYYNSVTGKPPPGAADTFGWTAAVFIRPGHPGQSRAPLPEPRE